jgi:hypothetical protein
MRGTAPVARHDAGASPGHPVRLPTVSLYRRSSTAGGEEKDMQNWIAGAMTVLGTLLVLSGAGIIILRAWPRAGAAPAEAAAPDATGTTVGTVDVTDADRGARALRRLGPPDRLIAWGIVLLVLAALAAGAIGFELGANVPAK